MMKLSKRMKAIAAMITPNGVLADVGTDHGYIPIYMAQQKQISKAIAMDINRGPLSKAQEHIKQYCLAQYIETRLSDGVDRLEPNEADTIVIAGMGGDLTIRILKQGESVCRLTKELILQPQSKISEVREFLRENNYKIVDEDMVYEDGKYYPIMRVIPVEKDFFWDTIREEQKRVCDIYGPLLLKNGNPTLRRFLVCQHRQLTEILAELENHTHSKKIETRKNEIKQKLYYNESAYTIMGEIKHAGI